MPNDRLSNEYFEWIFNLVCDDRAPNDISYRKLLMYLHNTEFRYSIPKDVNRAKDGVNLRYRFTLSMGYDQECDSLDGPCSILEMMVALAIKCEEFMDNYTEVGDRTRQWFWGMITNLGLGSMTNSRFDRRLVDETIERFLDREYEPDGKGGLFRVRNCDTDLRTVEIWYQLCWYLDSIM